MAFFEKVLKKEEGVDIEEFLNNLDEVSEESMYEDAEAFVKPIVLESDKECDVVLEELKKGNFILLNIANLAKRNTIKLRIWWAR